MKMHMRLLALFAMLACIQLPLSAGQRANTVAAKPSKTAVLKAHEVKQPRKNVKKNALQAVNEPSSVDDWIKTIEQKLLDLPTENACNCFAKPTLEGALSLLKSKKPTISKVSSKKASATLDESCGCPVIPFTLGNGLPEDFVGPVTPIPNSDGSFGPFIITTPGNYVLQNSPQMEISNSVYTPNNWQDANPAIIIQSSDVDLDLCGNTITGSGNLTQQYFLDNGIPLPNVPGGIQNDVRVDATIGILVNPEFDNLSNIAIHGGKLQYHMTSLLHWVVSNMRVYDMRIENNGSITAVQNIPPFDFFPNAVVGQFGSNITYDNIQFLNSRSADMSLTFVRNAVCTNFESAGVRGNTQANTTDVYFSDPEWVEFGQFAAGLVIFFCDNTVFDNIVIRDLKALLTVFGIYVSFGSDTRITNCLVSDVEQHAVDTTRFTENFNQFSFEARAYAIEFVNGSSLVEDCIADNINIRIKNVYDVTQLGSQSIGGSQPYNICCGSESVTVRNCEASNISTAGNVTSTVPLNGQTIFSSSADAYAVYNDGSDVFYENCSAVNVNGGLGQPDPTMKSDGIGFQVSDNEAKSFNFVSCTAVDCIGNDISSGFKVRSNSSLTDCQSSMSPTAREAGELGNGFFIVGSNALPDGAVNILRECTARNHSLNGFEFASTTTNGLVVDSISNGNALSGFNVSGTSISLENNIADFNGEYGFHVDGTRITVLGNSATQNGLGGFFDDSPDGARRNHNFYARNHATDNGTCQTYKCNFDINYVKPKYKTVLQTGTLYPTHYPQCCFPEANISLSVKAAK